MWLVQRVKMEPIAVESKLCFVADWSKTETKRRPRRQDEKPGVHTCVWKTWISLHKAINTRKKDGSRVVFRSVRKIRQEPTRRDKKSQDKTRDDHSRQGRARYGKTRRDKTRQQDKTRKNKDKTRTRRNKDKTRTRQRQANIIQVKTRQDQMKPTWRGSYEATETRRRL